MILSIHLNKFVLKGGCSGVSLRTCHRYPMCSLRMHKHPKDHSDCKNVCKEAGNKDCSEETCTCKGTAIKQYLHNNPQNNT